MTASQSDSLLIIGSEHYTAVERGTAFVRDSLFESYKANDST